MLAHPAKSPRTPRKILSVVNFQCARLTLSGFFLLLSAIVVFGKNVEVSSAVTEALPEVRAGACAVDITPETLPVIVNGEFLSREINTVKDRLHARAIVLESGAERFAICVVDSLTIGRELLDEA